VGFKEDILKLSAQVGERKDHVTNEEMTKNALVLPFIQTLGFDVFNPLEVKPEYYAAFGGGKNARIDYAICKDDSPIMFFEVKPVGDSLKGHHSQLRAYFNATPTVRIAVITNGITYRFYTDFDEPNIMDDEPFFECTITCLSQEDIDTLMHFRKESFDVQAVRSFAEELKFTNALTSKLESIFKDPPDEFVKYLLNDASISGKLSRITPAVIERFRPIVKRSVSQALVSLVQKGLAAPSSGSTEEEAETSEKEPERKIATTAEELEAFELVKAILAENGRDISDIQYKDTTAYFSINYRSPSRWIIRLMLGGSKNYVYPNLPIEEVRNLLADTSMSIEEVKAYGTNRIIINDIGELKRLERLLIKCYDAVSSSN